MELRHSVQKYLAANMPTSRIWRRSRNLAQRDGWPGEHGVVGELVGE